MLPYPGSNWIGVSGERGTVTIAYAPDDVSESFWIELDPSDAVTAAAAARAGKCVTVGQRVEIPDTVPDDIMVWDTEANTASPATEHRGMVGLDVFTCAECHKVTFTLLSGPGQIRVELFPVDAYGVADALYCAALWAMDPDDPNWGALDRCTESLVAAARNLHLVTLYPLTLVARCMDSEGRLCR